ncbi:MAG TPA: 3-hydroxyacyl-CoA dehydrogenase, partial [Candidatus Anoxymicrobiaceae bacterium]
FVVGAGYMGNGIAQMAALAGYSVMMCDTTSDMLEAGMGEIDRSLGKLLSKGRITPSQREATLENLATTTALADAADADIVVEAVPERLDLKKRIFAELDALCGGDAILATNTSAISISSIASAAGRPERVVGTHFFGPVPLIRLCEIIGGLLTSKETFERADAWARSLGKETVLVRKDHAGFIANRTNLPGSIEAIRLVQEGLATPEQIDTAATFGVAGVPGPMQIMDNAGLEVTFNALMAIYDDTGEPRFYPPPLLRRMVAAGVLGRKAGRGFYDYSSGSRVGYDVAGGVLAPAADANEEAGERQAAITRRILLPIILESARAVETGVGSPDDVDRASRLGFNFPIGPLQLADSMGLDEVLGTSGVIYAETGNHNYFPPPLLRRMVKAGDLGSKVGRGFYEYETG